MNDSNPKKYIIITGGVLSGLGKGVASASIGHLFSDQYKISPIKLDGYLNSDPGTMNPLEHGEVFVLDDGKEVDMDFGHYERFLGQHSKGIQSITMGKIFEEIREKERKGDYLGKTVQFIPHVTNHIQDKIEDIANKTQSQINIIEVGGTVGDIENELFIEALRQFSQRVGEENICYIHLTYVPVPYGTREQKTKPTQQGVNLLQTKGIWPDIIIARSPQKLTESSKKKIMMFSNVEDENYIISAPDLPNIYQIPLIFEEQNLCSIISKKLNIPLPSKEKLSKWKNLISSELDKEINISIAGKYTELEDSYASIIESLNHCSYHLSTNINVNWVETSSQNLDYKTLENSDGVIIPGGFGSRGFEGKIKVIEYARENKIPFLGICYGLQLAIIEFLRNVSGLKETTSLEVDNSAQNSAITLLDEQKRIDKMGGTMRLGNYKAKLAKSSIISKYYTKFSLFENYDENNIIVSERHRHRYEVNPDFINTLEKDGMIISSKSFERDLVEFIELPQDTHPYFVATQGHPELKSKLDSPAPLFYGLVENSIKKKYN